MALARRRSHAITVGSIDTMRVAIDGAGRIVVPKAMRERLGVAGRSELELEEGDGQLVLRAVPSKVTLVDRDGHLVAERGPDAVPLDWEVVRDLVERQRR